jgi:hypothetical protein
MLLPFYDMTQFPLNPNYVMSNIVSKNRVYVFSELQIPRFRTEGVDILMSLFKKSFIKNILKDEKKLIHKKTLGQNLVTLSLRKLFRTSKHALLCSLEVCKL